MLYDRYGQATHGAESTLDREEMEDLMGALLELRGNYRNLVWFGEVNRRGFVKITKKLDKKISSSASQGTYLATKVDPRPFASNRRVDKDMRAINDWLSSLGDVKLFDDNASATSSSSLHRVSSKTALRLPSTVLDGLEAAVRADDEARLKELLESSTDDLQKQAAQKLLLNLLQRSIACKSVQCVTFLLPRITTLTEDDDMNKRNAVHRLVVAIGRARALEENGAASIAAGIESAPFITAAELPARVPQAFNIKERDPEKTLGKDDPAAKLLRHVLENLKESQRDVLLARDNYGRYPLHYCAQYGLVSATQIVIKHMQAWGQFDVSKGIDSEAWQDSEGYAPLHLSVMGGHYRTTKALLLAENWQGETEEKIASRKTVEKSGASLALATKSNFYKIVKLLVEADVDMNYQDDQGETALHVAARFGFTDCAKALLEGHESQKPDLEIAENTYGWTPLFIACVDGHVEIAELLISAGAEVNKPDISGWLPIEHAALRGHLEISDKLVALVKREPQSPHLKPQSSEFNGGTASSVGERRSNGLAEKTGARPPEAIKTFGHRYLTDKAMVLVSLGSMDMRKNVPAVTLDSIPLADAHSTQLDTALSIVVSASGAEGEPTVIDLPVQENISTSPITFLTADPTKVKLLFDIVPTYSGSMDKIVGRGVAMLSSIKPSIGSKRMLLQGDLSVPIVAAETLDVIGSVNFNFLIITPFKHPHMTITKDQTYWKSTSTMVIGHRGLGKNQASLKSLQLGENTISSFIAAANLGASYVEFDVQLTKDHVPVIYHDFLVSETGVDVPVHNLTLEQFLHISEGQTPRASRPPSPKERTADKEANGTRPRKHRSYSVGGVAVEGPDEMSERMKHTRDFKLKGYKGNSRGNFIQEPFTTLQEMFKKLEPHIGFNIEMSKSYSNMNCFGFSTHADFPSFLEYPMLHESEEHEMDTYAVELNSFVDTVLDSVYTHTARNPRNIIFSSFNPDICLLLSFKQPSIPVLFLSDSGTYPVGDIRASSLQEAIRFASRWNLLGIVSAAEPLVACPRLVKVVKESGLVCVSYGALNNENKNVEIQANEGIDAVIVDNVLAIRKGLTSVQDLKARNGAGTNGNADANASANANRVSVDGNAIGAGLSDGMPSVYENGGPVRGVNGAAFGTA